MIRRMSIPVQTMFVDLVERTWRGKLESLASRTGGSAYRQERNGRGYWYWQPPSVRGKQPSPCYVGPDTPSTSRRIDELAVGSDWSSRQRHDLIGAHTSASMAAQSTKPGGLVADLAQHDPAIGSTLEIDERTLGDTEQVAHGLGDRNLPLAGRSHCHRTFRNTL